MGVAIPRKARQHLHCKQMPGTGQALSMPPVHSRMKDDDNDGHGGRGALVNEETGFLDWVYAGL